MFLTPDDLFRLTRSRRKKRQLAWLREHGWKHTVDLGGFPVVATAEKDKQLVSGGQQSAPSRLHWDKVA